MRKIVTVIIAMMAFCGKAQDVHFTMFHLAPTIANPAAAGMFSGTFRAGVNYRSQWRSVTKSPYRTYTTHIDGAVWKNKRKNAYMGAGVYAYRDIAGSTNFGTTKIAASLSSILHMDNYNSFSIGLQAGWAQLSMSPSEFQWDTQYDGDGFNPDLPSHENIGGRSSSNFDFAGGIMWSYSKSAKTLASFDDLSAEVGLAYHHFTRPQLLSLIGQTDRLHPKYVLHGEVIIATPYSKVALRPRLNVQVQGPAREYNLGLMFRYMKKDGSKYTGNVKGWAISAGAYYRVLDAISPSVELELAGFSAGFSYDFTLSRLTPANYALGGAEVYLRFQNPNPFFRFSRTGRFRF